VLVRLPKNVTDEQILFLANDSIYGLAGAYFGETGRCLRLARKTEAGIVWVNGETAPNVCIVSVFERSRLQRVGTASAFRRDQANWWKF
jgi:acyl-CoA reductase-like NAD-dependent aldehyde dehydrogenase